MYRLVIAEKPSVAMSIAKVLGAATQKESHMEGSGWLVSWCIGHLAGCTKPMKRLWISSMEDSAIREGFENLRPGSDYDGLHQAALCRQKADWLVGINATRLFSVLYGRTLNIGRVMSPTLALIVQREAEIAAFEPPLGRRPAEQGPGEAHRLFLGENREKLRCHGGAGGRWGQDKLQAGV